LGLQEELAMIDAPKDDEINSIYITFENKASRQIDLCDPRHFPALDEAQCVACVLHRTPSADVGTGRRPTWPH
jgi:hypothetical protein